ncbi:uncharacterized protein LOC112271009 [Brachypodium distachyon]|uniref:uncharacterized protein LOC112271009 n=1 Tax=Brachypodium distachyon TaxID=15368 RepID=UPI000D0DE60E|nr:uncharacterized protein LOC112271009 [Brachypodium distachyon]|eukprot:XP_024315653.1 uncharacterized protein LOC112271009 [Brachypodium distachyon]
MARLVNKKDAKAVFLATILATVMAMSSSCHAANDECYDLLPCTANTCSVYCKQLGYKEPKIGCWRTRNPKAGNYYGTCCCNQHPVQAIVDGRAAAPAPEMDPSPARFD